MSEKEEKEESRLDYVDCWSAGCKKAGGYACEKCGKRGCHEHIKKIEGFYYCTKCLGD